MSSRWCWRDAEDTLTWLQGRAQAYDLLSLLAHLPLADALLLARLVGVEQETAVYHHLHLLRRAGLIAAIRIPLGTGSSPHRFHLADLGLATLALDWGCEPVALARRFHLRRADLFALLPGLPQLAAAYEVLGALAASQPGRPSLLAWERPWRARWRRPTAKTWSSVSLPVCARLSWDGTPQVYLFIPDLETIPMRLYRTMLDRLLLFRRVQRSPLPPLVVVTGHRRVARWNELLQETARERLDRPLVASVAAWQDLPTALEHVVAQNPAEAQHIDNAASPMHLPPLRRRPGNTPLPHLVGSPLGYASSNLDGNTVALTLSPAQRLFLDLVARHPFLGPEHMATVLGWQVETVRRRRNQLRAAGLVRLLTPEEIAEEASKELPEVTGAGLRLLAAQLGLTVTTAVRVHGLVGGGPEQPIGVRDSLIRNLAHTIGADELFVGLYRTAHDRARDGADDAVTVWHSAAACSRRHLRPDGYGTYRRDGHFYGFFLEYDRGTMNRRDYFRKFAAYYDYAITRRFEWDYHGYPTILVVTTSNTAEERIAAVVHQMVASRGFNLPLFLTTLWRLEDLSNRYGLLGQVWRGPGAAVDGRRSWMPDSTVRRHKGHPGH